MMPFSLAWFSLSYYKPTEYIETGEECCSSKTEIKCEIKPKEICLDLEEVTCEVCKKSN